MEVVETWVLPELKWVSATCHPWTGWATKILADRQVKSVLDLEDECATRNCAWVRSSEHMDPVFWLLCDHNYIRPLTPTGVARGPAPDLYEVNPAWDRGSDGDGRTGVPPPTSPDPTPFAQEPLPKVPNIERPSNGCESNITDFREGVPGERPSDPRSDEPASDKSASNVRDFRDGVPGKGGGIDYTLVTTADGVNLLAGGVGDWGGPVAVDTETTGLDPTTDRVRLLQLAFDGNVYVIDVFPLTDPKADLAPLFEALAGVEVTGHNLKFDLAFLVRLGFVPGRVFCTMLASQVLHAGERDDDTDGRLKHTLAAVADRELGVTLNKDEQKSDWSRPVLTPDQLRYAAEDVRHLIPLAESLKESLAAADLTGTADLEMRALRGVAWASPITVDAVAWAAVARTAEDDRRRLVEEMDAVAPNSKTLTASRNWNSTDEVKAAFRSVGVKLTATDDDALAGIDHPLAGMLRVYRCAAKRAGTYGLSWLTQHAPCGFVRPSWNQLGAESGRMSCSFPNLQQVPRDADYRRCFVARPGCVFVKADYSQIELRVAAVIADEPAMIRAYAKGEDLHTRTAARLLGKQSAEVTKPDRQLAKAINFGLLFGMGAKSLKGYAAANYGVTLTDKQAAAYHRAFFASYPKLARWHERERGTVKRLFAAEPAGKFEARTLGGRRRSLPVGKKKADGTVYPNTTDPLNFPVQGTAADGMKAAVALLWDRRDQCPGAVPVLFVHDEIVVEAPEADADAAKAWLVAAMKDGMQPLILAVPVVVDASFGVTWGG